MVKVKVLLFGGKLCLFYSCMYLYANVYMTNIDRRYPSDDLSVDIVKDFHCLGLNPT
jgi:hypothetical protein